MNILKWMIFLFIAFASFLPITRLRLFDISKKYSGFKYVSLFLFLWTIIAWLKYVVLEPEQVYYLTLAIYPTLFALTAMLFIAIMNYLEKKLSSIIIGSLVVIVMLEVFVSFTNASHHLMIDLSPGEGFILAGFSTIPRGIGFYIHTVLCYVMLIVVVVLIFEKLIKALKRDNDVIPFVTMGAGIILGVGFNIIHIFCKPFTIDPTYIAFVLLITTLYYVFYIRDLRLIIELGRNEFILDNFREMYVICDHRNVVVGASDEFLDSFEIDLKKEMSYEALMEHIQDRAIVYEDQKVLNGKPFTKKRYLHMQKKKIQLPLFKYQGNFYLFYDETKVRKQINDVEYVKSHDLMTELYNRNYFEEMKKDLDEYADDYSLIMFDLDGLKFYNDYLGHASGDDMLKRFANMLQEVASTYNMTAIRMGGDEFLLIAVEPIPGAIDQTIKEISKLSEDKNNAYKIMFSYGMASKGSKNEVLERVFSKADDEMYKMKLEQADKKAELKRYLKKNKNKSI
ncbi:MAG: diguanylate cyclase [Tenericutes bacterium]|nr:diguanylate cyclase [Mycoplasmatota bacterium]